MTTPIETLNRLFPNDRIFAFGINPVRLEIHRGNKIGRVEYPLQMLKQTDAGIDLFIKADVQRLFE